MADSVPRAADGYIVTKHYKYFDQCISVCCACGLNYHSDYVDCEKKTSFTDGTIHLVNLFSRKDAIKVVNFMNKLGFVYVYVNLQTVDLVKRPTEFENLVKHLSFWTVILPESQVNHWQGNVLGMFEKKNGAHIYYLYNFTNTYSSNSNTSVSFGNHIVQKCDNFFETMGSALRKALVVWHTRF